MTAQNLEEEDRNDPTGYFRLLWRKRSTGPNTCSFSSVGGSKSRATVQSRMVPAAGTLRGSTEPGASFCIIPDRPAALRASLKKGMQEVARSRGCEHAGLIGRPNNARILCTIRRHPGGWSRDP